jgi:hypothetical protein
MNTLDKITEAEDKLISLRLHNEVIFNEIASLVNKPFKELLLSYKNVMNELIDERVKVLGKMKNFKYNEIDIVEDEGNYTQLYYVSLYLVLVSDMEELPYKEKHKLHEIDRWLFNEIKNTDSFKVHQTCTSWITVFYYE